MSKPNLWKEHLEKTQSFFEEELHHWARSQKEKFKDTLHFEALIYTLSTPGKRFRPGLFFAMAEGLGKSKEWCWQFAMALEWIHTYSLVHDDLPAMDNDELRRDQPSTWAKFGEAEAILVGDSLLTEAFRWVSEGTPWKQGEVAPENWLRAIACLAKRSGHRGMVGGQSRDILAEKKDLPLAPGDIEDIHALKTGALFSAACEMPAILSGASEEIITKHSEFGFLLGRLFQATDDLFDLNEGRRSDGADLAKKLGKKSVTDRCQALAHEAFDLLENLGHEKGQDLTQSLVSGFVSRIH